MKPILLSIFTFIAVSSFSQIQVNKIEPANVVGRIKSVGSLVAEITYRIQEDKDTLYTLLYRNSEYSTLVDYQSVKFSSEGNTLNELYKIMKSVFADENKKNKDYKVSFKLGETEVIVSNFRMMGVTNAMFFTRKGHFFISDKQLEKLFGKVSE